MSLRLLYSIHFQAILLLFIVLLHINLTLFAVFAGSIGNETDRQALLAFKTQISHDPENVFSSWNDSLHFCEWEGVTCGHKHRRVTILDLQARGLVGSLSPFIGNLSFIREIVLFNNTIGGKIPDEVGRLFRLEALSLNNNSFNGNIPANLSHCSNLKFLTVGKNNLSGSIPVELTSLSKLELLSVHMNNLNGEIPPSIGNLSSLQRISAPYNVLGGHIPDSMGQLRSLTFLGLGDNKFSAMIPPSLYNLSSIVIFAVANNDLGGSLPTDLFLTLPHLQWFQIYGNQFTGSIPVSLSNASELKVYSAELNNFTGKSLVNFSSFQYVGLAANQFEGTLGEDRSIVAVKVLNLQRRGASESFISECEALKNIRHRNLVKIITSCSSMDFHGNDFKALVYEFMPNGSLENWLHMDIETEIGQTERNLNLLQRTNIAIDIGCALEYLHHHCLMTVVHCDLKPSNILFDYDMIAHVGDFGLAKFLLELMNPKQSSSIGIKGTIGYTAPEYGLGSVVSTKGDVYSYGIILLEMITGKRPTHSMFSEGLNLHKFASMALPNCIMEIMDPKLLNNDDEVIGNDKCSTTNRTEECLISMVKVGVACSMMLPQERWDISKVISELHWVRNILLSARI
ncbi:hypothetical protein ACJW30_05G057200 [Castanea mollissima]